MRVWKAPAWWRRVVLTSTCLLAIGVLAAPARAQTARMNSPQTVTADGIQQLQDQVYDAGTDLTRLRTQNPDMLAALQSQLDDLRDEVIYMKVKLRREGQVPYDEFAEVRDHLQNLRTQIRNGGPARGTSTWSNAPSAPPAGGTYGQYGEPPRTAPPASGSYGGYDQPPAPSRPGEIPAGQEIDVRLERDLSSKTAQPEDRITATTVVDLNQGNDVLIPAGSRLNGIVTSVEPATRTDRKGSLTVAFDRITIHGTSYPMHATVVQALESEGIKGELPRIGAGSAVGAIIGGILGGAKGALLGVLIGGGGTIAATEGTDVNVPAGTILRIRLDQALVLRQ